MSDQLRIAARLETLPNVFGRILDDGAVLLEARKLNIEITKPMLGKQMAEFIEMLHRVGSESIRAPREAMNPRSRRGFFLHHRKQTDHGTNG